MKFKEIAKALTRKEKHPDTASFSDQSLSDQVYNYVWDLRDVNYYIALKNFYTKYQPDKINEINEILSRYEGEELLLFQELCKFFNVSYKSMNNIIDSARNKTKSTKSLSRNNSFLSVTNYNDENNSVYSDTNNSIRGRESHSNSFSSSQNIRERSRSTSSSRYSPVSSSFNNMNINNNNNNNSPSNQSIHSISSSNNNNNYNRYVPPSNNNNTNTSSTRYQQSLSNSSIPATSSSSIPSNTYTKRKLRYENFSWDLTNCDIILTLYYFYLQYAPFKVIPLEILEDKTEDDYQELLRILCQKYSLREEDMDFFLSKSIEEPLNYDIVYQREEENNEIDEEIINKWRDSGVTINNYSNILSNYYQNNPNYMDKNNQSQLNHREATRVPSNNVKLIQAKSRSNENLYDNNNEKIEKTEKKGSSFFKNSLNSSTNSVLDPDNFHSEFLPLSSVNSTINNDINQKLNFSQQDFITAPTSNTSLPPPPLPSIPTAPTSSANVPPPLPPQYDLELLLEEQKKFFTQQIERLVGETNRLKEDFDKKLNLILNNMNKESEKDKENLLNEKKINENLNNQLKNEKKKNFLYEQENNKLKNNFTNLEKKCVELTNQNLILSTDKKDLLSLINILNSAPIPAKSVLESYLNKLTEGTSKNSLLRENILNSKNLSMGERIENLLKWKRETDEFSSLNIDENLEIDVQNPTSTSSSTSVAASAASTSPNNYNDYSDNHSVSSEARSVTSNKIKKEQPKLAKLKVVSDEEDVSDSNLAINTSSTSLPTNSAPSSTTHGEWIETFDPKSQRYYYYNKTLNKSTWTRPAEFNSRPSSPQSNSNDSSSSSNIDEIPQKYNQISSRPNHLLPNTATHIPVTTPTVSSSIPSSSIQSLPPRPDPSSIWIEATDPTSGRKYWYNKETKKSTWTRPIDL